MGPLLRYESKYPVSVTRSPASPVSAVFELAGPGFFHSPECVSWRVVTSRGLTEREPQGSPSLVKACLAISSVLAQLWEAELTTVTRRVLR